MKICLVTERVSGHGGWYTYTQGLHTVLRDHAHTVTVISKEGADGDFAILPSPLDTLGKPWLLPKAARALKSALERMKPDVIHITVEPYALLAALLPKKYRDKTIVTIHGSYGVRPLYKKRTRLLACRYYKRLRHFITVSDYTKLAVAEALQKKCRTPTCANFLSNVRVIRNGIPLPPIKPRKKNNDVHQILLVGGVKPRKGVLEALDACGIFKKLYGPKFFFTIAGVYDITGYAKAVRKKIGELHLEKNVRIAGPMHETDLYQAYENADLYLMPSPTGWNTFEGYGIVFLEANAFGVPCIGPDKGGAAEAIVDSVTGFRVDIHNPQQIAERMHQVLNERRIKPEDCRAWAEAHKLEDRVKEIEEVYASLM